MDEQNEWMNSYVNTMKEQRQTYEKTCKQTIYVHAIHFCRLLSEGSNCLCHHSWTWMILKQLYSPLFSLHGLSLSCSVQLCFNPMGHIFTEQPVMVFNIRLFAPPPSALYDFSDPLALVFRAPAAKHIFSSLALDSTWGFIPLPWS